MKKLDIKTGVLCLAVVIVSTGLSIYLSRKNNSVLHTLPLIQNYKIDAVRGRTQVSASVKFWDTENDRYFFPSKIDLNGQAMKNEAPDKSVLDSGCPAQERGDSLPGLYALPDDKQLDPSAYSLTVEGSRLSNTVTIYDESGAAKDYEISFEALQFARQEPVLSRSKDNVIQLKGRGGKEKDPIFGLENADRAFESLLRYDAQANTVTIPAAALKNMKKGSASFWIISSDTGRIETPSPGYILLDNRYTTVFTDVTCAQIVD